MTAEQTDLLIALWKDELEQLETAYKQALIRSKNEEKRLTALVVSERERADKAEQERDAQRTGHGVMFARAVRAETALRGVAVLLRRIPWLPEYAGIVTATVYQSLSLIEDSLGLSDDERGTAPGQYEAALSGLAGDTEERQPCS